MHFDMKIIDGTNSKQMPQRVICTEKKISGNSVPKADDINVPKFIVETMT